MFYLPFPFPHTLSQRRAKLVEKKVQKVVVGEDGKEKVEDVVEFVPDERILNYIPAGNSKFSTIEIDTRDLKSPKLKIEVVVDGHTRWQFSLPGKAVSLASFSFSLQLAKGLTGVFGTLTNRFF